MRYNQPGGIKRVAAYYDDGVSRGTAPFPGGRPVYEYRTVVEVYLTDREKDLWGAGHAVLELAQRFNKDAALSHDLLQAQSNLDAVAHRPDVSRRWPRLAQALINLGQRLALVGYALEVNVAAEAGATRDAGAEAVWLRQLLQAMDEVLPEGGP